MPTDVQDSSGYQSAIGAAQDKAAQAVKTQKNSVNPQMNGDFGTFIKMLTTELQYQDPTDPLDTKGMAQQLAMFSSVEQQTKTNEKLDSLVKISQSNGFSAVANYVGKQVELESTFTALQDSHAEFSYVLAVRAQQTRINILDENKHTVLSLEGQTSEGKHTFVWDGKDASGKVLEDGTYTVQIESIDTDSNPITPLQTMRARVTGATFTNDEPTLLVGRLEIPLDSLISMTEFTPLKEEDSQSQEVDRDHDGHLDLGLEDIDHDGHLDAQNEDINGNGKLDMDIGPVWGEDRNHNNLLDEGEDLDGDGQIDHSEDINGNGRLDTGEDKNGNGRIDQGHYSEDLDGDGRLDTGEDRNHNGLLDEGEDLDGDGYLDLSEDLDRDQHLDIINEDLNHDGFLGTALLATEDLDHDGRLDPGIEDLDGDGRFDKIDEDLDHDGRLDVYEVDTNHNNILEPSEDLDHDGRWDSREDLDGDGRLDTGEDRNHNGRMDPGEDVNQDGHLAATEDLDGDGHFDNAMEDANQNGMKDPVHGPTRNDEYAEGSLLWRVSHAPQTLREEELAYLGITREQQQNLIARMPATTPQSSADPKEKLSHRATGQRQASGQTAATSTAKNSRNPKDMQRYTEAVDRWMQSRPDRAPRRP